MINKVTLIGNLGRDPEVRHLESGSVVARFSVATNENYQDKEGQWQTRTEWHLVVAWRNLATRVEKALRKGSMVYVEGKLRSRKYTDSQGIEKSITEIEANLIRPLDRRESQDGSFPTEEPPKSTAGDSTKPASNDSSPDFVPSDDLPF